MFRKNRPELDQAMFGRVRAIAERGSAAPETEVAGRQFRNPSYRPAKIAFGFGECIDVVVLNHSSMGARIDFIKDVALPEAVLLNAPTLGIKSWCEVVWQSKGTAGLQFRDVTGIAAEE